jgi:hypothetical protein
MEDPVNKGIPALGFLASGIMVASAGLGMSGKSVWAFVAACMGTAVMACFSFMTWRAGMNARGGYVSHDTPRHNGK